MFKHHASLNLSIMKGVEAVEKEQVKRKKSFMYDSREQSIIVIFLEI